MKKVFVLGVKAGLNTIEKVEEALKISKDVEIIHVESIEDVPLKERLSSDPSVVQKIYTIDDSAIYQHNFYIDENKKKKGYEKPYKYHR
jgi:hypothetical protein